MYYVCWSDLSHKVFALPSGNESLGLPFDILFQIINNIKILISFYLKKYTLKENKYNILN